MEPSTSPKTYWSVPKSFHNNKKYRFPPISHKNRVVTNFKEKIELFNFAFAKQCSVVDNGREIPFFLHRKTDFCFSTKFGGKIRCPIFFISNSFCK